MLELSPARKNKVNLSDYNCEVDIANRMLMSDFSAFEYDVLEEILFSPLKCSLKKIARNMVSEEAELNPILQKLIGAGLLSIQDDAVIVDKEKRKYFEFQMTRFDPDFKPDMEFLQGILRKVSIHFLPSWYSISRSSNNIFESIVEKYLLSPQIFQRYMMELNPGDPRICAIIEDVFSAPDSKVSSSDLIAKYNLSRRDFEEIILFLEFNFICCLTYEKEDDHWLESVAPFHEWHEYLRSMKATEAPTIPEERVSRTSERDFGFIEDLSALLLLAKKAPLPLDSADSHLTEKLCLIQLAERKGGRLVALDTASDWLEMSLENRALHLYRHPLNRLLNDSIPADIATERNIREAEKSVKRVLHGQWVFFDDFIKGVMVPLSENSVIMLKRVGKHWKYTLPIYSEAEKALIKATLFEWLSETGMVATGVCDGRDCFAVTPFGRFFFEE
jgi:hypothetical protein